MLNRTVIRSIKTWTQYYAESLGVTEQAVLDIKKSYTYGSYDIWKHRNEVTQKIHFILDHCTPEEQKVYLKDFTSEDLVIFLRGEVYSMSDEDLKGLDKMYLGYHALPGVNFFLKKLNWIRFLFIQGNDNLTPESKLRRIMIEALNLKLKELEWKNIDRQISGSI